MACTELAQMLQSAANLHQSAAKLLVPARRMQCDLVVQLPYVCGGSWRPQIDVAQEAGPALAQIPGDGGRIDELQTDIDGPLIHRIENLLGRKCGDRRVRIAIGGRRPDRTARPRRFGSLSRALNRPVALLRARKLNRV